jgi:glycosyltransferase involved in cell wall biosynthesis
MRILRVYRIAMVADASAPISPRYPGHGLGQAVHRSALALGQAGHCVEVFAGDGSTPHENYSLMVACSIGDYSNERQLAKRALERHREKPFDAIIDHTHTKAISHFMPAAPVLSWYHDIFMRPCARNPVMVSQGMKYLPGMDWAIDAPVVHHWVDEDEYTLNPEPEQPPYALFLGLFRDYKQPILAIQACALAGIRLVVAGTIPGTASPFTPNNHEVVYVGGVVGEQKVRIIQNASVLLQLGNVEAFGLTTVESALCGTPVVAWPAGGTLDLIEYKRGVDPESGVYVQVSRSQARSVADSIHYAMSLPRERVRDAMRLKVQKTIHALRVLDLIGRLKHEQ